MGKAENVQVEFGIKKIQLVNFFINEKIDLPEQVNVSYGIDLNFNGNEETIDFVVKGNFMTLNNAICLYNGAVLTRFLFKDLTKYVDGNNLNLPDQVLATLFSISFTHARSILATYTNGTIYNNLILPIINPSDVLKQLIATMVPNQDNVQVE